jgi:outer membrane protein
MKNLNKGGKVKNTFLVTLIVLGIILLGISNAHADDKNTLISIEADYWMPSVDAEIKSSELSLLGTQIDLIDDLGLDDSDSIPALKGSIDLPLFPEILVSYFQIESDSTKTLTKNFNFGGITYSVSDVVKSSYDITQYEALIAFALINADSFKIAPLIGAKYFEVEASLTSTAGNSTEKVDGPVPVIGALAEINLPSKFRLTGIARGLQVELDDLEAKLYDIEAAVNYDFNRFLRAQAGYRYFLIDAEDNSTSDSVDIKFAGPFIGVTGSF